MGWSTTKDIDGGKITQDKDKSYLRDESMTKTSMGAWSFIQSKSYLKDGPTTKILTTKILMDTWSFIQSKSYLRDGPTTKNTNAVLLLHSI